MGFHGDLFSFPLPELLQWLDASRKTGTLQLCWDAGTRKLFILSGQVAATSAPALWERIARALEIAHLAQGQHVLAALAEMRKAARADAPFLARGLDPKGPSDLASDDLYAAIADLTQAAGGEFHWTEDPDRTGDEWVPAEVGLRHVLFESLRWVDEQAEVERALPLDSMTVQSNVPPSPDLPLLSRIILILCERGQNLGRLRLSVGMSRTAVTRRVFDLLKLRRVTVDGAPQVEADPIAEMLEKGALLVRERQFEAAALIFSTLLASDPTDRRVREFAHMVEREHVASLYRELPPIAVPALLNDPEALSRLRPEERQIAAMVNGKWDISTIVLASQHRELETLKAVGKLERMGLIRVGRP